MLILVTHGHGLFGRNTASNTLNDLGMSFVTADVSFPLIGMIYCSSMD